MFTILLQDLVLKLRVRHNRGATITGFDSKLVKSCGLVFQKNEMFEKACHQVIQPSSRRIVLRKCKIISLFNVVDCTLDLDVKWSKQEKK